jgi:hypothetical protein
MYKTVKKTNSICFQKKKNESNDIYFSLKQRNMTFCKFLHVNGIITIKKNTLRGDVMHTREMKKRLYLLAFICSHETETDCIMIEYIWIDAEMFVLCGN